jgi:hypothetical protein
MTADLEGPEHWRLRVEETKRLASESTDPEERMLLQEIARLYEQLATRVEDLRTAQPSGD